MMLFSQKQARRVDEIAIREYGLPGLVLMENAGRNSAQWLQEQEISGPVTIVTGKGNNAGDGFVMARFLHNWGLPVRLLLMTLPTEFEGDAAVNWNVVEKMRIPIHICSGPRESPDVESWLQKADWIVDALLGTGLTGEVREPFRTMINRINAASAVRTGPRVFAVDLPSGLDGDTGQARGATIRADLTATFAAMKRGLVTGQGPRLAGQVEVLDIGVPREVLERIKQEP